MVLGHYFTCFWGPGDMEASTAVIVGSAKPSVIVGPQEIPKIGPHIPVSLQYRVP